MADINYPQRWLSEHIAKTSNIGWYRPKTYEILKCQKGLVTDPINVTEVFLIIPDQVDCKDIIPLNLKFLPRVASELDYEITISDSTLCELNTTTNNFEFLDKHGEVTITVTMKSGGATSSKKITINKKSQGARIIEGNTFVIGIDTDSTIELLPSDSSEKVLGIDVWNNKDIHITNLSDNKYKIKCDIIGDFILRVYTEKSTHKIFIKSIENKNMLVESISMEVKPAYNFNENIFINPTFIPSTATLKDYSIYIENLEIAKWISGRNVIKTNELNGTTKVTIQMINGPAKFDFDLKVKDSESVIIPEDIELIIPSSIKEKEEIELTVKNYT